MFGKQLTIGKRIGLLAICLLALLFAAGALSYTGVGDIVHNSEEVISGNQLDGALAQKEVDHLNWVAKVNALLTDPEVTTLQVQTDDHKCGFGKWLYGEDRGKAERLVPALAPLLKQIEAPHHRLHASAIAIGNHYKPVDENLGGFLRDKKVDHLNWMHALKDAILDPGATSVNVQMDPTQCGLGRWLGGDAATAAADADPAFGAALAAIRTPHEKLHHSARAVDARIARNDRGGAHDDYLAHTKPAADATLNAIDRLIAKHQSDMAGIQEAGAVYTGQTLPALADVQTLLGQIRKTARENILTDTAMLSAAQTTRHSVLYMAAVALVVGGVMAFLISRGITRVLRRVSDGIGEAADQVASAAGQVSASSQSLADGASEQAASVEETAASIQEISAQGKEATKMTQGAEALMNENIKKSAQSLKSLVDLTQKMDQIEADSDKIGNIIKTIDEIAFQTNLLALNAAVEAARAGEAGAGFAVVADEVRNLAMRATEAAKSTQHLLDGTLSRIGEAAGSIKAINSDFEGIIESATVMGEKTEAITVASRQQAEGLNQIDKAVNQIEQVTQQVAASAEESSAASEELTGQAEELRVIVADLARMVYGTAVAVASGSADSDVTGRPVDGGRGDGVPRIVHTPEIDRGRHPQRHLLT